MLGAPPAPARPIGTFGHKHKHHSILHVPLERVCIGDLPAMWSVHASRIHKKLCFNTLILGVNGVFTGAPTGVFEVCRTTESSISPDTCYDSYDQVNSTKLLLKLYRISGLSCELTLILF